MSEKEERYKDPERAECLPSGVSAPAQEKVVVTGPVPSGKSGDSAGIAGDDLSKSKDRRGSPHDSSDDDGSVQGRQFPVWKKKLANGARSRGEWRRKTNEASVQDMEQEISGLKDALADVIGDKAEKRAAEEKARQDREQAAMLDEAKAKFRGRAWSFTEEVPYTFGEWIRIIIGVIFAAQWFAFFSLVIAVAVRATIGRGLEGEQQGAADFLTMILGIFTSALVYQAVTKAIDHVGRLGRWVRVHRYKVSKIRLETVDPARRPLAMQLTKCEYTHPICALVTHYFEEELMLLPDWSFLTRAGRQGWRVGFTQHRSSDTVMNVSLEILVQLIVPKNTAVESADGTMANALTASVKALHAVAVDRVSNAVDNIVEETKLAAYGLIKSHKERVQNVPFPRTAN